MDEPRVPDVPLVPDIEVAASTARTRPQSSRSKVWARMRRSRLFIGSVFVLALMLLIALVPGLFATHSPYECDLGRSLLTPSRDHWFGTDLQGCDYYSRVMYGARTSIVVGVTTTVFASLIAVIAGAAAGYFRGIVDVIVSRLADMFFAIPLLLAAVVVLAITPDTSLIQLSLVLAVFGWPAMMRLMRASVLTVAEADYVTAARAIGASHLQILRRHILPNAFAPVLVYATMTVGMVIAAEATLTYLGVGFDTPSISWGLMVASAQERVMQHPYLLLFPGLFLSLTILGFVLLGDALRDALDPRSLK